MPLLGCIADDLAGATDLASGLVRGGMRTVQIVGPPDVGDPVPDADAVVVALRSRTAFAPVAVAWSLAALAWLRTAGCERFVHAHSPTFDSTDDGTIGPVADALVAALGCGFAPCCPALPASKATVYQGHLFVGGTLLGESGMRDHPLTPMCDSNLVRVLSRQTDGAVGLVPFATVERGPAAIRAGLIALKEGGRRYGIVDALTDAHLMAIGEAAEGQALVTGSAGVALGLSANVRRSGRLCEHAADRLPAVPGHAAVLAGSCSRSTLFQLGSARHRVPTLELDPLATPDAEALAGQALAWAETRLGAAPVVIAASAVPERVAALRRRLGREAAGALVEDALATVAAGLVGRGVRRLLVAGGETGAAVVERLGVRRLRIGAEIDPGVPWTLADGACGPLLLALTSGNRGGRDLFLQAFETLGDGA